MSPPFVAGQTFNSTVATDGLDQFILVANPNTISIVDDPAGLSRKVIRFDVADTDTAFDLPSPRGQMTISQPFTPGDEVWYGLGLWLPSDWPEIDEWLTFAEVYGPPSTGASAVRLAATGADTVGLQRGADHAYDWPWTISAPLETWMDIVVHEKLSTDAGVGFVEVWLNTGSGWVKQTFSDASQRLMMSTLASTHSGGANRVSPKQYRSLGNGLEMVTSYMTDVRLGDSIAAVDPHSHD